MDQDVCPICLEYLYYKNIIKTPCNHTFHKSCLETWNHNCPLCRSECFEKCAWFSEKQFKSNSNHKKFPYIYYKIIDNDNNQKIAQITEIGQKSLFDDAICLGKVLRFHCVSEEYKIFN